MNKALIIVDLQNDFLKGGALAIAHSAKIIPRINKVINLLNPPEWITIATMDEHPTNHVSFKNNGGVWPAHCVKGTTGSLITSKLITTDFIVKKGQNALAESYSGFYNDHKNKTDLEKILKKHAVKELYLCGLALDYCVFQTALDGMKLGFEVYVVIDLSTPITTDIFELFARYQKNNIKVITTSQIPYKTVSVNKTI